MLVLSRRAGERIVLPSLNISIQVLQVKGNTIRLGIEAPPGVRIVREEILAGQAGLAASAGHAGFDGLPLSHQHRNRLNTAMLALNVVQKQLQAGLVGSAESMLRTALEILDSLGQPATVPGAAPEIEARSRALHALVVEDDLVEESLLTSFLRLNGFQVATAHDGYEALEYLSRHTLPDFMLLDMRLPRLNGPETISAIRTNPRYAHLRIFAVSGSRQEELGVVTGPEGVDRWFQKPVNPVQLAQAMSVLDRN